MLLWLALRKYSFMFIWLLFKCGHAGAAANCQSQFSYKVASRVQTQVIKIGPMHLTCLAISLTDLWNIYIYICEREMNFSELGCYISQSILSREPLPWFSGCILKCMFPQPLQMLGLLYQSDSPCFFSPFRETDLPKFLSFSSWSFCVYIWSTGMFPYLKR